MGPCGGSNDTQTTVGVLAKNNTVNNFEIAFNLPTGVTYSPGTATIFFQEGSNDFALSEVDISNLNAPVFRLERPSDENWQVADRVRFRFDKTASCDAVQFSYAGGLFKDAHTITYDDLNGSQTASDNDATINSYNFFRAYLAVGNYSSVSANIEDHITRTLEVSNAGNGNIQNFTHSVFVSNDIGSYSFSFIDLTATRHVLVPSATNVTPAGTEYVFTIDLNLAPFSGNIGDGDIALENETVFFEESFNVDGCNETSIGHQPSWGCSATEVCQVPELASADIILDPQVPIINVETVDGTHDDFCGTSTHQVTISNDATTATAFNVRINLGFGFGSSVRTTDVQNGLFGNDHPIYDTKSISNFRFGSNPSFTIPQRPSTQWSNSGAGSYFIGDNFFPTSGADPDGPGGLEDLDGDGFYDDLAPGASTTISMDSDMNPRTLACGTSQQDYIRPNHLYTDAYAEDQCSVTTPTGRDRLQFTYLRRFAPNTNAPTDIFDGQSFDVSVRGRMFASSDELPHCNGTRLFSNDPSSAWTVTLNVPLGISLDGTPSGYTQVDANTIVYTTTDLPASNTLDQNITFPLNYDCSLYTGPSMVPISYTTRYSCDCFDQEIQCGTISGIRSQCPISCDGPAITSFDTQRETAGWTDNTMTTQVVLDPNVHNVDTYMAKDEMVLRTSAVMSNTNPNSLLFDLDYGTLSAGVGGSDIIQFVNGTITINDLSSGTQTVPITVAPTLTTNGSTTHTLTFDLSSYTTAISPTYSYGEPSVPSGDPEADEINLELHFVFKENFTSGSTLYELQDLMGRFYDENNISCGVQGDRAYYFKNLVDPYDRGSTNTAGCRETFIELLIRTTSVGGDQFPGEYRPPVIWSSTDLEIPVGAEFTGRVTSVDFLGTDPTTANGGLSVSQSGNVLTISPVPGLPAPGIKEYDQGGTHHPRIRVHFRGSSTSPPSSVVSWSSNYQEFAYSSAPVNKIDTDTHPFNFSQPDFTLASATPIVSGDQATAFFEVDLCMDNSSDIGFNWLQINNGTSFTVLNAVEVVGAVENPLTFSESAGNTWVQLDNYTSGTNVCKKIRFEVSFTQCSNFDFIVENAWDCDGYPADFTTSTYLNQTSLRLEPKEAALQIAILNEPASTIDICSNFNIDLELRNAGNGDLISPQVTFDIPGDATSLILNGINLEYPRNSGDIQPITSSLSGNTVTLNLLEHTGIAVHSGIQGSLNTSNIDNQIAIMQLDLSVQCNFISNTAITYEARGNNPCGEPATGDGSRLSTNPIVVTGAEPTYDAISNIAVPAGGLFAGCNTETITVETIIVGGPTSFLDYARIILPDGLAFDPTTFVSNNSAYPVTYSSVTTVGNHEEFIVNMPDGANNGANPSYSFDVTPKNTTSTCSPGTSIEVNNFVVTSALTCGPVSCGTTEIANGSTFENIIIAKPELVESSFTTNADYTTDGTNYSYDVAFGIENIGTVDISAGFTYDVYCADGSGLKIGSSIYSGSVMQPIPAGNAITESVNFSTTNFCGDSSNIIVELVPSSTNCHCDVLSILIASEPEIADLEITNTVTPTNVLVDDTVTFTVEVFNQGPFDADGVLIESLVPQGYTPLTINNGGTLVGNIITWPTIDNLPNSTSTTLSFTATVNEPTGALGEFESIAQVVLSTQFDNDSDPNNYDGLPLEDDEDIASVHVLTADLNISKGLSSTSSAIPTIGETVTYEVTVGNNGPDSANSIQIEDVVPSGLTVNPATISNGGLLSGNTITWNIPTLNNAANLILSYDASVNIPAGVADEFTNIAQVVAVDEYDPNSVPDNYDPNRAIENDEAVHITSIQTADLELINTVTPTSADPGDLVSLSIEITNSGPNDATGVSIENIVPAGLSVTNIGNSGSQIGNTITWSSLNIPNGTSVTLNFEATVNVPTNVADEYLNTAQITASNQYDLDSFPNNDDGDQSEDDEDNALLIPITADLSLTKGLSATSNLAPNTGETVTFELVLTNSGPDIATNVTIEDIIPSGFTLGTVNDGGLVTENTVTWVIPNFTVGSQTLSYEVIINEPVGSPTEYTNIAQVTTVDQYDPNSAPNNDDGDQSEDDEDSYTIAPPTVDLEIIKTSDKTQSYFEDTIEFTVMATNNSVYEATNIGIEDVLPAGFVLVSQTTDLGAYNEAISTWEIPALAPGATAQLTMIVTVTETADYTNIAELSYLDQIDDNVANDRDEVTITVTQEECLTVFNEFSPNNDGANDTFFIECIDQYPNNTLQVFNRWGIKVFEMRNYDNTWDGTSTGRATINESEKLPVGTYYYTLEPGDGTTSPKAGWLYISR